MHYLRKLIIHPSPIPPIKNDAWAERMVNKALHAIQYILSIGFISVALEQVRLISQLSR